MIGAPGTDMGFATSGAPLHADPLDAFGRLPSVDLGTPILVVEDEAMIAWLVESLLEDMGFTAIALAATGEAAIAAAQRLEPGLIITDINLGAGIDGIAAAVAIRAEIAVPVIFITGYGLGEAMDRVAEAMPGVPVLRKPVQVIELRDAISSALGGSAPRN